jgi:hypothetical protein
MIGGGEGHWGFVVGLCVGTSLLSCLAAAGSVDLAMGSVGGRINGGRAEAVVLTASYIGRPGYTAVVAVVVGMRATGVATGGRTRRKRQNKKMKIDWSKQEPFRVNQTINVLRSVETEKTKQNKSETHRRRSSREKNALG